MMSEEEETEQVEELLATPDLAGALESERFRRFLDQIPIALVVAKVDDDERIIYVNPEFEKLTGLAAAGIAGRSWSALRGAAYDEETGRELGAAIIGDNDYIGTFRMKDAGAGPVLVDAYSNIIEDDYGNPSFRLAALVNVRARGEGGHEELEKQVRKKDMLLREIQHRVKNNLQIITALIRLEARNAESERASHSFDRLAGRIQTLQLLYESLSEDSLHGDLDLGVYLSRIASAVMKAHASEGIRLDLQVAVYPVSVNVAMPTGLVVNELLMNSLKHAFQEGRGGTITLHSFADDAGCRLLVADDGVGLPDDFEWPRPGKLSALIVQSLRENAKASFEVESTPGGGTRVHIVFSPDGAAAGNSGS